MQNAEPSEENQKQLYLARRLADAHDHAGSEAVFRTLIAGFSRHQMDTEWGNRLRADFAKVLQRVEKWDDAIECLRTCHQWQVARLGPASPQAWWARRDLGFCLVNAGQVEAGGDMLEEVVREGLSAAILTSREATKMLLELSIHFRRAGKLERALATVDQVLAWNPPLVSANESQPQPAPEKQDDADLEMPYTVVSFRSQALGHKRDVLAEAGRADEAYLCAMDLLESVRRLKDTNKLYLHSALEQCGRLALAAAKYEEAIAAFDELVRSLEQFSSPDIQMKARALVQRATCQRLAGKLEGHRIWNDALYALRCCETAYVEESPWTAKALEELLLAGEIGAKPQADCLEPARREHQICMALYGLKSREYAQALARYARALIASNETEAAADCFERLSLLSDKHGVRWSSAGGVYVRTSLARALGLLGQYSAAVALLDEILGADQQGISLKSAALASASFERAEIALAQQEHVLARRLYREAAAHWMQAPNYWPGRLAQCLGGERRSYLAQGNLELALSVAKRAWEALVRYPDEDETDRALDAWITLETQIDPRQALEQLQKIRPLLYAQERLERRILRGKAYRALVAAELSFRELSYCLEFSRSSYRGAEPLVRGLLDWEEASVEFGQSQTMLEKLEVYAKHDFGTFSQGGRHAHAAFLTMHARGLRRAGELEQARAVASRAWAAHQQVGTRHLLEPQGWVVYWQTRKEFEGLRESARWYPHNAHGAETAVLQLRFSRDDAPELRAFFADFLATQVLWLQTETQGEARGVAPDTGVWTDTSAVWQPTEPGADLVELRGSSLGLRGASTTKLAVVGVQTELLQALLRYPRLKLKSWAYQIPDLCHPGPAGDSASALIEWLALAR